MYQPLIWRPRGEKATVPLSAFLSGPTKGSINEEVFNQICPENEVIHVQLFSGDYETQWAHAKSVLEGNDRCVVVDDWIFNWKCVVPHQVVPVLMNIMYKLPCIVGHSFNLAYFSEISRKPFRVVKRCLENS